MKHLTGLQPALMRQQAEDFERESLRKALRDPLTEHFQRNVVHFHLAELVYQACDISEGFPGFIVLTPERLKRCLGAERCRSSISDAGYGESRASLGWCKRKSRRVT